MANGTGRIAVILFCTPLEASLKRGEGATDPYATRVGGVLGRPWEHRSRVRCVVDISEADDIEQATNFTDTIQCPPPGGKIDDNYIVRFAGTG